MFFLTFLDYSWRFLTLLDTSLFSSCRGREQLLQLQQPGQRYRHHPRHHHPRHHYLQHLQVMMKRKVTMLTVVMTVVGMIVGMTKRRHQPAPQSGRDLLLLPLLPSLLLLSLPPLHVPDELPMHPQCTTRLSASVVNQPVANFS